MANLFDKLNEEGVVIVASSRKGSEQIYRANDGMLYHVQHLKSGRDEISPVEEIPDYLTVRYSPLQPAAGKLYEFVNR